MVRAMGLTVMVMALALSVSAAQEPPIPVYGNWQGEVADTGAGTVKLQAKVIAKSWDTFCMVLTVAPEYGQAAEVEINGKTLKGVTSFKGDVYLGEELGGSFTMSAEAAKGIMTLKYEGEESGEVILKRVLIKSPTLGMEPPEGAIVLIDGTEETYNKMWNRDYRWMRQSDGSIGPTGSSIVSKQAFGDAEYHVEFLTPYMPNDSGQGRGNSGVYVEGRYEVQVLDSFGDKPANNLCGGIYQIATPLVNACLPPDEWQTYDITFHAPKFENGKKVQNAQLTVKHNGTVIHDDISLPHITPGGVSGQEASDGPLLLQDHGNFVRYRNVWIKPLN